ncbi:MAG TPA: BACON domain-containing carbohydrate-binding protein, partial [Bacteroidales bacterium]|nr:BACON domain-containing carbohydrate-binding protein [Bacteroidales bacterium]
TSYGNNQTFTPGGVMLTTAAITNLQTNSATSGGNITSDGGSPITARGVCWGTTANPVIGSGNFTSDGTGIGTFVSNIQGLSSNTVYYVRAYATNSFGTFYGDNVSFQTLCGLITNFPWTEGFENGGNIPACWTQEQVNNSGVNWQFITGNGTGYPANAYSGTYNACLKDNTSADNKTRLITPPLDLSNLSNPVLTFYHTQAFWSPDQDILTVFYRTSSTGTWIQLVQYTSSVTTWTLRTINLPNPSSEYYIAFEGNAKYGRGVCVDEVTVNGTSSTPNLSVTPSNQNQSASAGSVNFTVTSNVSWNAVSNQSWCTVTPSGSGNGTLVATVTENTNPTQRIAQITVSATGVSDVLVTVTQAAAAQTPFANVLLRPQQADIASTTSQGAVLMQVGNYTSNDAKYRLFNGSNQYNVWNGSQYVTSNTYADNPSIPGTPTTGSTWWIVYQRGTNNSVTASYRDRLSPYSANHLTTALPAATAIVTPVTINGTIPFSASYPLNVKYVILGYDAPTGGNLISATSSDLTTGAFALVVEQGTVIQRLEVRNLLNELMESQTGTWPGGNPPTLFTLSGGGSYCQGTSPTGISASLSGSETNAIYQLLRNSLPYGDPVSGTGNPIVWNNLIAGTYTVTATNSSSQTMNGQAVVTETPSVAVSVTIQASAT